MRKHTFKTIFSILIIQLFLISGCTKSDNPVTPPTSGTVNGKVVDQTGAGVSGVTVYIDSNIITSNFDGTFSIPNINTPYDVKMVHTSGGTSYGYFIEGISLFEPNFLVSSGAGSAFTATFNVTIPAMNPNQRAYIFFTDNNLSQSSSVIDFPSINTSFGAQWNTGNEIPGKVIVLVCTMSGGNVISYDKYGEKDTLATTGGTYNISFTDTDLSLNPGEANISGTVVLPPGYTIPKASNFILFSNQGSIVNSSVLGNAILSNSFDVVVPTGLPTNPRLGIVGEGSVTAPPSAGQYSSSYYQLSPGTSGNIVTVNAAPGLGSPIQNATGINLQTNFSFSSGSGPGIYIVNISGPSKRFYVTTGSTTVKIPDFSQFGLNMVSGESYSWYISKIQGVGSVNDMVSTSLMGNSSFMGLSISETRNFTAGN